MDCDSESVEQTVDVSIEEVSAKRKMTKTSDVWNYFVELPVGVDKKQKAKCSRCGAVRVAGTKNGTGSMKKHLEECIQRSNEDSGQMLLTKSCGALTLSGGKFNHEKFRELIISAMIKHELPFSFVEYEGIREIFQYLHPDIQLVSRNTAKADAIKLYHKEKLRLKRLLENVPGRVSFTSDAWTSLTSDGYICLTAHFIDKDWKLQKRILNFSYMPPPHTGIALSKKFHGFFSDGDSRKKFLVLH